MIVIAHKTETKLRDDLQKVVAAAPNKRVFYLQFSKTDIDKDVIFETFLKQLEELPNSYMARIYLCEDKDVLILLDGFMQRQFLEFVNELATELAIDDLADLTEVFEARPHWEKIQAIYTKKLDAIKNAAEMEKEEKRKQIADHNTLKVMHNLDPAMVSAIAPKRENRSKPLLMIADDDQLSRTIAGNILRAEYDLIFAKNGSEALEKYVESAPDLLFLDIGMPDIGGHEVLESLFQIDPEAYIIMFSGRNDKKNTVMSLEKGAQGFLGKPFTRDQLYMHVESSPYVQAKLHNAA